MKHLNHKKRNRIALISLAAAMLVAGSSFTAFAAARQPVYVTYAEQGNSLSVSAPETMDIFKNIVPGQTTDPQDIVVRNRGSKKMRVYFQAQPGTDTQKAKALLDTLNLEITFQADENSAKKVLYSGHASGKSGTAGVADIVTDKLLLGTVNANSETGTISAVIRAPSTMGNEFQSAAAEVKWVLQLEAVTPPPESIGDESTPLVNPSSAPAESIGEEPTPLTPPDLTKPPKTGQDSQFLWIVLIVALVSVVAFIAVREKIHHAAGKKK